VKTCLTKKKELVLNYFLSAKIRLPLLHIVYVCPHNFQGNAGGTVVCDHSSDFVDITVTVSALMEAEA
jgi:ligand-binding SRPBCC domain-containing protein